MKIDPQHTDDRREHDLQPTQSSNDDDTPKDPLAEMLANLMGGKGMEDIDPAELAKAAGLPDDPNMLAQMFSQVQAMMSASSPRAPSTGSWPTTTPGGSPPAVGPVGHRATVPRGG